MADSKVSELASATSIGGSDLLYLVQSSTSKKVTASTLYSNAANVTLSGRTLLGGTPQTLAAPGIINVNTPITHLLADSSGGTLNIPQGSDGQIKLITLTSTAGGSYIFNSANIAGNTTIELDTAGDTVVLVYTNSKWAPISSTSALDLSSVAANIIPSADSVYNLGSPTNQWKSLYVSNNTIFVGGTALTILDGELVIGSGEASANLATVAYVDAAVANVGGGSADTGNITFTNTTLSSPDGDDLIITAANAEVRITGEDFRVETTDDIRLQASDLFSLRNISQSEPITIVTDYNGSEHEWRFGEDGSFQIPGDTTVAGDITGTSSASTLVLAAQPNSNTSIQLNDSVDSIIRTVANLEIRTDVTNTDKTWVFDTDGVFTTPGDITTTGSITGASLIYTDSFVVPDNFEVSADASVLVEFGDGSNNSTFSAQYGELYLTVLADSLGTDLRLNNLGVIISDGSEGSSNLTVIGGVTANTLTLFGNITFDTSACVNSEINSIPDSSGDGEGATTLQLVPDDSLKSSDQYLIIDPTQPSHIHIRAGGTIDNSVADLYLGGENSYFRVAAGENPDVQISANSNIWSFYEDGELLAPGLINAPSLSITGKAKFNKVTESYSGIADPTGVATFDCSSTHIFNVTSINANFTANFTNLDLDNSEATSLTLVLNQGATAYIANVVQIGGVTQTVRWQANAEPTGNVNAIDIQSFSILNVGGNYTVLGQLSTFG